MNNSKILSILPLLLVIGFTKGNPQEKYASTLKQASKNKNNAKKQLDEQIDNYLNKNIVSSYNAIEKARMDECYQQNYWRSLRNWDDQNTKYYTNSDACKQLEKLQKECLKSFKNSKEWPDVKPSIQDFRTHDTLNSYLESMFNIQNNFNIIDNNNLSQERKKELLLEHLKACLNQHEDDMCITYAEVTTPEIKEQVFRLLSSIIEDICSNN
jgi:hypothetical protein